VVKERFGSGSAGTRLGLNPDEAYRYAKNLSLPIYQPYIRGQEYSIDVYVPFTGKNCRAVTRSRDKVIGGESKISTIKDMPILANICCDAAQCLGLAGHAVFQAIIDENNIAHIIECNCRVGGASTLSMQAGLSSLQWFLLESVGRPLPEMQSASWATEMQLVRIPYDTFHFKSNHQRS
jgi:carbamoyl-phosphate synthase large subunit